MITAKAKEFKKEYHELFLKGGVERGSNHEKKLASVIWKELINNCNPTRKEFNEITNYIVVTPEVFFLVMKRAGFWQAEKTNPKKGE